jgi:hypothetical protein
VAGVKTALEMAATGNPIEAKRAFEIGLVDKLLEGDLEQHAVAYAHEVKDVRPIPEEQRSGRQASGSARQSGHVRRVPRANARKMKGFEAPEAVIKAIQAAVAKPYAEGVQDERRLFMELMNGTQARAQQYFFFAERKASKIEGLPEDTRAPRHTPRRRDRRRHDGRRHLDELPLRRHPRDHRRDGAGGARPRHRHHPQELRGNRVQGQDDREPGGRRDGPPQPRRSTSTRSPNATSSSRPCSRIWT